MRQRQARILATIGPASSSKEMLKKLIEAGADGFRLNFSHGDHKIHKKTFQAIRALENDTGRPIAILQDLQGPKIRLGELPAPVTLEEGQSFILDGNEAIGDETRAHLPHPEILELLKEGHHIYINDGLVKLRVVEKLDCGGVKCIVLSTGAVSSRKGVNLPDVDLPVSAMTEKDRKDLKFGLSLGVDWVAVSFVQKAEDVLEVKQIVKGQAGVMAKIEKPNAVNRIDDIIAVSDAIMVARGDLGVEVPLEEVPSIQKRLIRKCRERGKPVVVATQMLESMIKNASPTRAEVSDVANATYEGADTLMLSAETASGDHPVTAVETMDRVIQRVERSSAWRPLVDARGVDVQPVVQDAICNAAYEVANSLDTAAIVTFTESGTTSVRMSRQRPEAPILALTPYETTARRMALTWGLNTMVTRSPENDKQMSKAAVRAVKDAGLAHRGTFAVLVAGVPFGITGTTNMVYVVPVVEEAE